MQVEFFNKAVDSGEKGSDGLPLYTDVLFIKRTKSPRSIMKRAANDADKAEFAQEYAAFEAKNTATSGTPLDTCDQLSPADIQNLRARGCETIQAALELKDVKGIEDVIGKIEDYAKGTKGGDDKALKGEVDELKKQLESAQKEVGSLTSERDKLTGEVDELTGQIDELTKGDAGGNNSKQNSK